MDEDYTIPARVIELTATEAVLSVEGQNLRWPLAALPSDVKQGDTVKLRLISSETETQDRHEQARVILAEILGGGS
jgi:hypothetical protein